MGCSSCSNNKTGVPNGCKSNGSCGTGGCDKMSVFDWLENMQIPSGEKPFDIVEIRFKNDRKEYFRNSNDLSLYQTDIVAVEAKSGVDIGVVSLKGELVKLQLSKKKITDTRSLPSIVRKANEEDVAKWHESREEEKRIMPRARMMAIEEKLKMKISDVEYQGDMSKATFYYTADQRVDFRELIKKFSSEFKVRIEMKQIGMRQEAGKLGGIGSCGRELCCSTWLTDFRSVNTSAARYQQLSLNPQKLAGQCGKLKCCLNFELDAYMELMKTFPKANTTLQTEGGKARHMKTDVFSQTMWFSVESKDRNNDFIGLSVDRVLEIIAMNKAGKKPVSLKEFMDFEPIEDEEYAAVDAQDSLTRFDNTFKSKKKKRKPNNRNKNRNSNNKPTNITKTNDKK
jgi:cell fate regulator YaaT (PSP1 superfamily)